MKNRTIAGILTLFGYLILAIGICYSFFICSTMYGKIGALAIAFAAIAIISALMGCCVFLALSRILSMLTDFHDAQINRSRNPVQPQNVPQPLQPMEPVEKTYDYEETAIAEEYYPSNKAEKTSVMKGLLIFGAIVFALYIIATQNWGA